ncbi:MAG: hypothetical protein ABIK62_01550, partial [candidate division WOR-3 bacterium]
MRSNRTSRRVVVTLMAILLAAQPILAQATGGGLAPQESQPQTNESAGTTADYAAGKKEGESAAKGDATWILGGLLGGAVSCTASW